MLCKSGIKQGLENIATTSLAENSPPPLHAKGTTRCVISKDCILMAEWSVTVRIKLLHKLLSPIQQAPLLYVGAYIVMLLVLLPKFGMCLGLEYRTRGRGYTLVKVAFT